MLLESDPIKCCSSSTTEMSSTTVSAKEEMTLQTLLDLMKTEGTTKQGGMYI